ncbi:hypothetical protein Q8A67_012115 [Cirrhinus molitorella]|uniref:Extracellular calcium-sensing receptor-like protein n=1 Tax=Cirrhinus molitorella TaxID=172907 RepID=A0AA88PXG5_9TELE|nr:hypothetical protein Q8A67_012115 [Cirrhinus molitorella]
MAFRSVYVCLTVLLLSSLISSQLLQNCRLIRSTSDLPVLTKEGDITIGALFSLHDTVLESSSSFTAEPHSMQCSGFNFRTFRWMQTMIFAIEKINKEKQLLANLTLGYKIYDSCSTHFHALRTALALMNENTEGTGISECRGRVPVVIGDGGSTLSLVVARFLGVFHVPQLSYFSSCACLSNKLEFPAFLRTMPSDFFQVDALAQLVRHFGWSWVGTFAGDDAYGRGGAQIFNDEVTKIGACIAFYEIIPKNHDQTEMSRIVRRISESGTGVVLVFALEQDARALFWEALRQNLTDIQWLASEAWITAAVLSTPEFHSMLQGSMGYAIRRADIPGLQPFLLRLHPSKYPQDPFVVQFWEEMFKCTLGTSNKGSSFRPPCNGSEILGNTDNIYSDVSQLRISYNVYKAVYAIAYALDSMLHCEQGKEPFTGGLCPNTSSIQPWQHVHFTNDFGEETKFDSNGDPVAMYDLINLQLSGNGEVRSLCLSAAPAVLQALEKLPGQTFPSAALIALSVQLGSISEADCKLWKDLDSTVVYKEGHVVLAGMFPIHSKGIDQEINFRSQPDQRKCRGFNMRVFRWSQAMIFFIEEINQNPTLLPNITLGYRLYDTCGLTALSLRTALSVVSQPMKRSGSGHCSSPSIPIIIGDSGSTLSMAISRLLNLFRIPLVSYFASCACLSDKHQFPYFFRTIPSDVNQASALARLVKHFGWTWVGTVGADDAYGRTGIDLFTTAVTRLGVCVAYRVIIPKLPTQQQLQDIVMTIRDSTARVLVVFAIEEDIKPVVDEIVRQNVTGKQWVASEAWVTSTLISTKDNYPSLSGTIGFAIRRAEIPGFKLFLESIQPLAEPYNAFAREFWETQFQCSLDTSLPISSTTDPVHYSQSCTGMERVQDTHSIYNDVSELRVTYNMHKAIYTVAHALHNLLQCQRENRSALTQQCPDIHNLQPWQVVEILKKVNYTNTFGDLIHFDKYGDPVGSYDVVNWQRELDEGPVQYVTVGRFDSSLLTAQQLVLNQNKIIWHGGTKEVPVSVCSASCPQGYRKVTREGQPVCCYDCVLCAEGSISNTTDQAECILCPEDFWSNQHRNHCVPKQIEFLSYSEAFGMALAAIAILVRP